MKVQRYKKMFNFSANESNKTCFRCRVQPKTHERSRKLFN